MTNEKAIKELSEWLDSCCGEEELEPTREAFMMAIEALKAQEKKPMKLSTICLRCKKPAVTFSTDDDIPYTNYSYCEDCLRKGLKLLNAQIDKDINVPNTDCIYRQAAIDAILAVTGNSSVRELYEHVQEHGLSEMWSGGVNAAIDIIIALPSAQPNLQPTCNLASNDCISRKEAIDAVKHAWAKGLEPTQYIEYLPSAQPDRDIPKKPNETTDRSWGIPHRQAVCPNCGCYLGTIHFIGEGDKRKVTYCESCGQAIDWEGWEEDD